MAPMAQNGPNGTSFSIIETRKKDPSSSKKRRNARRLHDFLEKKNTCSQETIEDASKSQDSTINNMVNRRRRIYFLHDTIPGNFYKYVEIMMFK